MDKKFLAAALSIAITSLIVFHYMTAYFVQANPRTVAYVARVIDGDTLETSAGERVRLLGVNSPEVGQYYHDEAMNALKSLVENKSVEMEKDAVSRDRYNRLLRHVFVGNKFINLGLVRNGYAHAYIIAPNTRYSDEFRKAQEFARNNHLGIWKRSNYSSCVAISSFNYSDDNEFVQLGSSCGQIPLAGWAITDESSSHVYKFANNSLQRMTVHSGFGIDNSTDVFW
ncbi:thermonuclease family protein, partial [archaeon]